MTSGQGLCKLLDMSLHPTSEWQIIVANIGYLQLTYLAQDELVNAFGVLSSRASTPSIVQAIEDATALSDTFFTAHEQPASA
jgi:hypothetical protein